MESDDRDLQWREVHHSFFSRNLQSSQRSPSNRLPRSGTAPHSLQTQLHAFQKADLPMELLGDLRALTLQVKTPLAIRSSSLLEDALGRPFAGVYATKMIPNNQPDADSRFRRLVEAIKFVYASTYFREARDYRATGVMTADEKMAVIIQEVVGLRRGERFYPDIAGVARSYNYYALEPARPEDGVVTLALGLGKTIVDGGLAWTFSPAYPQKPPPFASVDNMLDGTQKDFWAVNMGKPPTYDPVSETEYLVNASLSDAESDGTLDMLASTYNPERDRVVPGVGSAGPRILNFAPMLVQEQFPLNPLVRALLAASAKTLDAKVEIEFALTFELQQDEISRARLGFLQVRSMVVSDQVVDVSAENLMDPSAIVASDMVIGNGDWSQISGARTIVEATLPEMNVELSQGSHFFHNLSSFRTNYFMVQHGGAHYINWNWLNQQPVVYETELIRHVRPTVNLSVRVDGRTRRGVILPEQSENRR